MTNIAQEYPYYGQEKGSDLVDPSIADKIFEEENKISGYYNECYQSLSEDMLGLLRSLRPQIQQKVVQYVRGEIPCSDLRDRVREFVKKKTGEYEAFKLANPDNPFILQVEGDYEKILLDNLVKEQTIKVLEQEVNKRDMIEAQKVGERLGIRKEINN